MQITIKATSSYANRTHERTVTADVPPAPPASDEDDRDDWCGEYLLCHTGDGRGASEHGSYEVEVLACDDQPELVGLTYGADG
jgi:hypothetical protein